MQKIARIALGFMLLWGIMDCDEARAQAPTLEAEAQVGVFERDWALSSYVSTWQGDYQSIGLGGRLRYEPLDMLGLEVYGEAFYVDWPETIRHDYPVGFNIYAPWAVTSWLRLRPLFGFCAVFSFIEPLHEHAPRADDVMFGVHGGGGVEVGVSDTWSIFFDTQEVVYFGHDREVDGWTGAVGEALETNVTAQINLGLQLHL